MKSQINKNFVRALCAARGWRQADLAAAAHLDPSTISRVAHGDWNGNMSTLDRVAAALGVTAADLLSDRPVVVRLADDAAVDGQRD